MSPGLPLGCPLSCLEGGTGQGSSSAPGAQAASGTGVPQMELSLHDHLEWSDSAPQTLRERESCGMMVTQEPTDLCEKEKETESMFKDGDPFV